MTREKHVPAEVRRAAREFGTYIGTWRRLHDLTAAQLCDRADISRDTLRRLERGDVGVSWQTVLRVLRCIGMLNRVIDAADPYETDVGRARADQRLPQRVRH